MRKELTKAPSEKNLRDMLIELGPDGLAAYLREGGGRISLSPRDPGRDLPESPTPGFRFQTKACRL